MTWDLFTYQEEIEKAKIQPIKYNGKQYREYIEKNFKPDYFNKKFYNILLTNYFTESWFESTVPPAEQLEWFKIAYSGFTYHFQNDKVEIFSLKHKYDNCPDEYSLFVHVFGDFIVEFPRVKDLFKEKQCAPACSIWWFNEDGTAADMGKYLNLTEEEKQEWINYVKTANEIINPVDTKQFSFSEWWRDRREYYFFYKLQLHKFGKAGRVFEKHTYDNFADYEFTFMDLYNYFYNKGDVTA